jgi:hypothetical protein
MFLGIKLEGWLTIAAIILGPLLAFAVQNWRDKTRERERRKMDIFRRLLLTLKVPMAQNHVDALNSIPLEFHSHAEIMRAWRLYTSHLNDGAMLRADNQGWGRRKFDLLVDLVGKIANTLDYEHIDAATLRDNVYVPQGYQDVEEQWRQIREAWQQVLNGQRPLSMTMVGPIQVEPPMQPVPELPVQAVRAPALPPAENNPHE